VFPVFRNVSPRLQLALLIGINLLNYFDRALVPALEVELRAHFLGDDAHAMSKSGVLTAAFMVCYMIAAPIFGWLATIMPRWRLIALGVAIWSLASAGSGIAAGFGFLLLMRALVGIGEAAYGPASPAILGDLFSSRSRGSVMALFYLAVPVGSALAFALGPAFAKRFGWEWAFYSTAIPGLLLAAVCLFMPERSRAATPPVVPSVAKEGAPNPLPFVGLRCYLRFFGHRAFMVNSLAMVGCCFCIGAMSHFFGEFLSQRGQPPGARTTFGLISAAAGITGTMVGGLLTDFLRTRVKGAPFLVCGLGALLAFPCVATFVAAPFPAAWLLVFLAVFFLFLNTGPSNAAIASMVPPDARAAAFALNIFLIHALGDAISPTVVGLIADRSSLATGFLVVSAMLLVSGAVWLSGRNSFERAILPEPVEVQPEAQQ
jgi:MFS family permease